jgi:hypothetical protein
MKGDSLCMRRFFIAFALLLNLPPSASARIEFALTGQRLSADEGSPVERAIAAIFHGAFGEWKYYYQLDSKVSIDNCRLAISGSRFGRPLEDDLDLSTIDWNSFRMLRPVRPDETTKQFTATLIFQANGSSGYFDTQMFVPAKMPSQSAMIDAIRFIHDYCGRKDP